jgi:hypothetical protein
LSLLWRSGGRLFKRRLSSALSDGLFPSWSWAGWTGTFIRFQYKHEFNNISPKVQIIPEDKSKLDSKDVTLQFVAHVVTITPRIIEKIVVHDVSEWVSSSSQIGIELARRVYTGGFNSKDEAWVLVVREKDGCFFREGICSIEGEFWDQLTKETRDIKLG